MNFMQLSAISERSKIWLITASSGLSAPPDIQVSVGRIYRPRFIYFVNPREFPEVKALVADTTSRYDLELVIDDETWGFVQGLQDCVETRHENKDSL